MEVWKDVPGWVGFYQVSSKGRVRSLPRTIVAEHPTGQTLPRFFKGRILKLSGKKYLTVKFTKPGAVQCFNVHFVILLAFVGEPKQGYEVCHNNGKRKDNRLENLRYDTRSANAQDRIKHAKRKASK